ncbi:hypothetical protein MED121_19374 [Marinomonas sp. MED121]|nr:hypothetical protein MED121_19374 [Marinomonas sp. MED121]
MQLLIVNLTHKRACSPRQNIIPSFQTLSTRGLSKALWINKGHELKSPALTKRGLIQQV